MHFQVTTKWKGKHRDFPYAPCPHTCTASPIINIIGQSGTFVTKAQPTSTHRNHPQALVCFRAHSWCLDKITMTWVHHDNVAQSIFNALKVLCALPASSPTPSNHWSFQCLPSFACPSFSYNYCRLSMPIFNWLVTLLLSQEKDFKRKSVEVRGYKTTTTKRQEKRNTGSCLRGRVLRKVSGRPLEFVVTQRMWTVFSE